MLVGARSSLTPSGRSPFQLGPTMAYFCALVPVVRVPGTWKTSVQPLSMGIR